MRGDEGGTTLRSKAGLTGGQSSSRISDRIRLAIECAALVAISAAALASSTQAEARSKRRHQHLQTSVEAAATPSVDAVELGLLAPPTRRSTFEQTYGDAAIARAEAAGEIRRELAADARFPPGTAPYPCEPPLPSARATVCPTAPGTRGYGEAYVFTPSYVSAPTTVAHEANAQNSLLPPFTRLFDGLNSIANGSAP